MTGALRFFAQVGNLWISSFDLPQLAVFNLTWLYVNFVHIGHYLANFVGSTSEASALELTIVKKKIDWLKYLFGVGKIG